jgi:hypothetical protein
MTRPAIPSRDEVLTALAQLQSDAAITGRHPSVLTLARQVGLANTTFRRNFPDIAADLARQAAERRQTPPPPSRYDQLQQTTAQLRQENQELRGQLELAYAVIQRITLENQRLRQQAEAAANITRLSDAQPHRRSLPPKTPRRPQ